jgi:hypothetical protein
VHKLDVLAVAGYPKKRLLGADLDFFVLAIDGGDYGEALHVLESMRFRGYRVNVLLFVNMPRDCSQEGNAPLNTLLQRFEKWDMHSVCSIHLAGFEAQDEERRDDNAQSFKKNVAGVLQTVVGLPKLMQVLLEAHRWADLTWESYEP